MPNISEAIQTATKILDQNGIPEPRREAKSLLSLAIEKNNTFLIAYPEYELSETETETFENFVERRKNREPFQHISGKQEFYGLDFIVSPDVLIPRPETELIVENALDILKDLESPNFCEVGVGSGCISVSILHESVNAYAIGLDISEKAIQIAEKNAVSNNVSSRLELKISDVFASLETHKKFDLIVSNPPYVPQKYLDGLQAEVRKFDPIIALTDGQDGLSIIRKIINESPKFLKTGSFLLMEIGFDQSEKVRMMFDPTIWQTLDFIDDLQGIPRMLKAKISTN